MADIKFVKPHSLSIAKAKALVQKSIDELSGEYHLTSEWHGNTLHFHRSGVDGQVHVSDAEIGIHINLGLLLKPFKGKLVDHIERSFEKLMRERGPGAQAKEPSRKAARTRG